jgi:hypothetical protein
MDDQAKSSFLSLFWPRRLPVLKLHKDHTPDNNNQIPNRGSSNHKIMAHSQHHGFIVVTMVCSKLVLNHIILSASDATSFGGVAGFNYDIC